MNILKNLRKLNLSIFLAFLVFYVSCEKYDINSKISKTKFDYSLFTTYQGKMLDIDLKITKKNQAKLTRLEINDAILEEINLQLGTNLDFDNDFKSLEITTGNEITDWGLNNSILDSNDIIILNDFVDTILANGVEVALVELENNVLQNNMDLSPTKIQKYEELANTVKLINAEDPELFDNNLQSKNCILAIVGLIFGFVALLIACASTVPTGGATAPACYWAAANFIRASITVGISCSSN